MVITLTGPNSFMLQENLRKLVAAFIAEQGEMAVERLDGAEVEMGRLSEALTSLPFLVTKKMVLLRQPSANKQFSEQAEILLSNMPETTEAVIVEPKLDKRSNYYKYLKKGSDFREYNELDSSGLARWLVATTKERGGTISLANANYIISRVGLGQQKLSNELDKLLLHAATITRESVDLLTENTPQSSIFELLDSAFAGNARRTLQLYAEQRFLKVEPQQIVAMLSWQLHILALIKTAGQRSPEAIAAEAKISPYVIKKSLRITQKLTINQLKQLIAELVGIDGRSKREALNIDDALQHYLLSITIF